MSETVHDHAPDATPLRRGWTTGACATAATKSALSALLGNGFLDPVGITLPGGQTPDFALAHEATGADYCEAGIIKDAGDDPDVTHGALVMVRIAHAPPGSGLRFAAGPGVGIITRPGLPLPVGEPAINPVPRQLMSAVVAELAARHDVAADFIVTIGVRDGEKLAEKTWNPRLGILGGLSILGTTGIVIPYSCAAWIHSIHRGIDVARAMGLRHVVGSTGDLSEKAAMTRLDLPLEAYLDMGDFVGGLLKYLKAHPVAQITIAGGFAKLVKLAQGDLDLHSSRSTVDLELLAALLHGLGAPAELVAKVSHANSANAVLALAAGFPLADRIAAAAKLQAEKILGDTAIAVGVLVVDRQGLIVGAA